MSATQTLYVATNGSDSNSGTIDKPFKSISAAAAAAGPGTQIMVRGGTYSGNANIWSSGTASNPIVIEPYGGEKVTLDGSQLASKADLVTISGNYVSFQGFNVTNAPGHGIVEWDTHNDTLANNSVYGNGSSGIWVGSDTIGASHDNSILNNSVHDNIKPTTGIHPAALIVDTSDNAQISGNTVYNNHGEGIDAMLSDHAVISQNTVHDNYSANIYLDNAPNGMVTRNFVYTTNNQNFYINGRPAVGIGAAVENYSYQRPDTNISVTNNIDVGDDYGLYYGNYGHGGGMQNSVVANNTFVGNGRSNLDLENDPGNSGNTIINNIFDKSNSGALASGSSSGFQLDHNLWFGGSYSGFAGAGDVAADPMLSAAGSLDPSGYSLQSGSPALGAGAVVSQLAADFTGATRTLPTSIGAFQA